VTTDSTICALRDEGFLELVPVEESSLFVELRRELDRGEAAALAYAIDADADLVLLDERALVESRDATIDRSRA